MIKVKISFTRRKKCEIPWRNSIKYKRNLISFLMRTISLSFVRARTFDRATTFTRTFDRDFVRGEYNDLNFCGHLFL